MVSAPLQGAEVAQEEDKGFLDLDEPDLFEVAVNYNKGREAEESGLSPSKKRKTSFD